MLLGVTEKRENFGQCSFSLHCKRSQNVQASSPPSLYLGTWVLEGQRSEVPSGVGERLVHETKVAKGAPGL